MQRMLYFGRVEAAEAARVGAAELGEQFGLARGFHLLVEVAHLAQRAAFGDHLAREGDGVGAARRRR